MKMFPLAAVLTAALTLCACASTRDPATRTATYVDGTWALRVRTDAFTRQHTCRLGDRRDRAPEVTAEPGALAFHFRRSIDTTTAWYRIDNGPPHAWRDLIPALVDAGAQGEAERLDNPTRGVVLIPLAELTNAQVVVIRPDARSRPRAFRLDGARPLLARADTLECHYR